MPTKARPVPWEDVVDFEYDVFEELVAKGVVAASQDLRAACLDVLAQRDSHSDRVVRMAEAIWELEEFRAAGKREGSPELARAKAMLPEHADLFFNREPEDALADALLSLGTRLGYLEACFARVRQRNRSRLEVLRVNQESLDRTDAKFEEALQHLMHARRSFERAQSRLAKAIPSLAGRPITLAGWRSLKKDLTRYLQNDANDEFSLVDV